MDDAGAAAAEAWQEDVHAAERKVAMAHYHLDCLRPELEDFVPPGLIPITLQAHFEGVLYCADAAVDQVTRALIQRFGLDDHPALRDERNRNMPVVLSLLERRPAIEELRRWSWNPMIGDARLVRNRATHTHYTKSRRLEVERIRGSQYRGTRQLGPYCDALVDHLDRLLLLFTAL